MLVVLRLISGSMSSTKVPNALTVTEMPFTLGERYRTLNMLLGRLEEWPRVGPLNGQCSDTEERCLPVGATRSIHTESMAGILASSLCCFSVCGADDVS